MLIRNQLRNQLDDIKLNDDTAYYYICALSTFAIKEDYLLYHFNHYPIRRNTTRNYF